MNNYWDFCTKMFDVCICDMQTQNCTTNFATREELCRKKHMGHRAAFLGYHLLSSLLNRQGVKDPFCVLQKYKKLQNKPLSGSESILISPFKPRGLRTSRIAGSACMEWLLYSCIYLL